MVSQNSPQRAVSKQREEQVQQLLEQWRQKIKTFAVRDQQGKLIGEVQDLTLSADYQVNLVISQPDPHRGFRLALLNHRFVQKIDAAARSLFVSISVAEMQHLPEYQPPSNPQTNLVELPPLPTPVSQDSNLAQTEISNRSAIKTMQTSSGSSDINREPTISQPTDLTHTPPTVSDTTTPRIVEEESVRLLEERLVVDRSKRKVGEVIVRKTIETRMVEIPVRREKLIVEQISPENRQLAEIDLGQGEVTGVELTNGGYVEGKPVISGEFDSPATASQLLDAIAKLHRHGCQKVRVELVLEDEKLQQTYVDWFQRYTTANTQQTGM